jgi:AhpD family alkylhydroperoxidase
MKKRRPRQIMKTVGNIMGGDFMEDYTKSRIEDSVNTRKKLHNRFLKNCKTFQSLLNLEENAFSNGAIDKKYKELMALSISIVTKCEPCMEWHVQQAFLAGATDEEIYETIDVAIEMGGGPAAAYARYALKALDYHRNSAKKLKRGSPD